MTLADLGHPATVPADAERIAQERDMSEDILIDHVLEVYVPAVVTITSAPKTASWR